MRIGDSVVIFVQGPIGLCATAGAKLMGASLIIAVEGDEKRLAMARRMGTDVALDYREVDVLAEVKRLTGGGADVAIEALGTQQTFESALRRLRPGGTLSSLGVYSGKLGQILSALASYTFLARRHEVLLFRRRDGDAQRIGLGVGAFTISHPGWASGGSLNGTATPTSRLMTIRDSRQAIRPAVIY